MQPDRFLVIENLRQVLAESEKSCAKQIRKLTTILQGLGVKQEVTTPTAEPPALNLQEETGKEVQVPDMAKKTLDMSLIQLKEEIERIKLPALFFFAVSKQDPGSKTTARRP